MQAGGKYLIKGLRSMWGGGGRAKIQISAVYYTVIRLGSISFPRKKKKKSAALSVASV